MSKKNRCVQSSAQLSPAMREWYAMPAGELLLSDIKRRLDRVLSDRFGYHAALVGCVTAQLDILDGSPIKHRVCVDADPRVADVIAEADALPFEADCLDVIVLMHTLEFAAEPHRVLREADRVLIPEGRLIVIGFNPWSWYGLWRLALCARGRPPWCGHFHPATQLKDWLSLLGFETEDCSHFGFRPPLRRVGLLARMAAMERIGRHVLPVFGGACMLVARKQVSTLTPLKPGWRRGPSLVPGKLAEPSARLRAYEGR
jgi:SAM-dependent methyltransferase